MLSNKFQYPKHCSGNSAAFVGGALPYSVLIPGDVANRINLGFATLLPTLDQVNHSTQVGASRTVGNDYVLDKSLLTFQTKSSFQSNTIAKLAMVGTGTLVVSLAVGGLLPHVADWQALMPTAQQKISSTKTFNNPGFTHRQPFADVSVQGQPGQNLLTGDQQQQLPPLPTQQPKVTSEVVSVEPTPPPVDPPSANPASSRHTSAVSPTPASLPSPPSLASDPSAPVASLTDSAQERDAMQQWTAAAQSGSNGQAASSTETLDLPTVAQFIPHPAPIVTSGQASFPVINPEEEAPVLTGQKRPFAESQVTSTLSQAIPTGELPTGRLSIQDTPTGDASVDRLLIQEVPTVENPVNKLAIQNIPIAKVPVIRIPIQDTPSQSIASDLEAAGQHHTSGVEQGSEGQNSTITPNSQMLPPLPAIAATTQKAQSLSAPDYSEAAASGTNAPVAYSSHQQLTLETNESAKPAATNVTPSVQSPTNSSATAELAAFRFSALADHTAQFLESQPITPGHHVATTPFLHDATVLEFSDVVVTPMAEFATHSEPEILQPERSLAQSMPLDAKTAKPIMHPRVEAQSLPSALSTLEFQSKTSISSGIPSKLVQSSTEILTHFIGPIAPLMVQQAQQQTSTPQAFVNHLLARLPKPQQKQFQEHVQTLGLDQGQGHSVAISTPTEPVSVTNLETYLTNLIGPIAPVMINQAKTQSETPQDLINYVMTQIPKPLQQQLQVYAHTQGWLTAKQ
jgi:hypothetical protein